ncbi:MAG: hypothetical protein PHE43_03540 [Candidatus Nanoarchaeia archaeon]|nr:hypothetical protein [Candidatus Nanoarchaeia archaeon]
MDLGKKERDVLPYYSLVSKKLIRFLDKKEIATRISLPGSNIGKILKRGSKEEPLYVSEIVKNVNKDMLKLRNKSLTDVKGKLNKVQIKIWDYFVPRKLIDFLYATNNEGINKKIERIFFDIDCGDLSSEKARIVTKEFVYLIKKDKEFNRLINYDLMPMWTGHSFHVYLFLKKEVSSEFYRKYLMFSKSKPLESFTGRWANDISKKTGIKTIGGHEKVKGFINIDPSQTPSGKLARAPFSLNIKKFKVVGIALPLSVKDLDDKNLVKKLRGYNMDKVIKDLNLFSKKIPKKLRT